MSQNDVLILQIRKNINPEKINEAILGWWKINPHNLKNIENVIVLQNKKVIGEYRISPVIEYNKETKRCRFSFAQCIKHSALFNRYLHYPTFHPASLAQRSQLQIKGENI